MPDLEIKIEQPPPVLTTIPPTSNDSSTETETTTALEMGKLIERVRQMEEQLTETTTKAEAAEARARAAEAEAEAARQAAAEAETVAEEEPPAIEAAVIPVTLEEPAASAPVPTKTRGRLATLFLGRD